MIAELEKNISGQIRILKEISLYLNILEQTRKPQERKLLEKSINSLTENLRMLNDAIPQIVKSISLAQPLPTEKKQLKKKHELEEVKIKHFDKDLVVVLNKRDKERFLRELAFSESFIKKIKKRQRRQEEKKEKVQWKGSRGYVKLANKFFLDKAEKLMEKGYFIDLRTNLRKANIDMLAESYAAMTMLTTAIAFFLSIFLAIFFLFFSVGFSPPYISLFHGNYLTRFLEVLLIPIFLPVLTFFAVYYYPYTEQKAAEQGINQELPFAVIHMSAISGSGISPSELFRIIGTSDEYPYLRKEIRKVLNQINVYGYDLVTALKNAAKNSPSEKLAELLSGLATTITAGSDLSAFLEKRAESLMMLYRLERQKYTKLIETFLDIYISMVITAPLIFLLIIIMLNLTGSGLSLSPTQLGLVSAGVVAILNIFFLVFLQIKQPSY